MPFQFREASCVIVGTFNIYIIRPDWLGAVGLLRDDSEVRIESQLTQPGFRLRSSGLDTVWIVDPNRIILQSDNWDVNCGVTADRLIESLPWTPLTALGCNFMFRGNADAIRDWDQKTEFPPQNFDGATVKQRSWHMAVQRDDQVFNLQMSEVDEGVEIRANVHTELRNNDVEFARNAARGFADLRAASVDYIQQLFNTEIQYE